ncbi:MAG TPA: endolytic transglycosylase MltG [Saprospiraceae bacterium]|nr:endolytic transglycosylase MltG [Candidatus Parvibacillus calidus]MBX2935704.1 endolytic transglycosylase MltG [Saprospiraceae bacterium]MBX7179064.1 endolytic transglycosylase MltG [Saprospiraceae bacterium]MCB0590407.1 endolytic transglycosylase MltG [Saprospiraceae bacterium]MCO5284587.1 endolytic transglycosylase MltG [Saprospiraceae bacterium]
MKLKSLKRPLIVIGAMIIVAAFIFKGSIVPNVTSAAETKFIFVRKGQSLKSLADSLEAGGLVKNGSAILKTAGIMGFKDSDLVPGRYKAEKGWNNIRLLDFLSRGKQTPLNLVINPMRKVENVAAFLGSKMEHDSLDFIIALSDSTFLDSFEVNTANAMTLFIPNTYQVYWNAKPKDFLRRMKKETDRFWAKAGRMDKLKALGMTKEQVYTLASIVDKETRANDEKPAIAGLYLNRLAKDMPLQADPTVVFAANDFSIKRVGSKQIAIQSPYNTYLNKGLPPGPISMASESGIDAVLNHDKHNYLYMCARPDTSGKHNFAETFEAHVRNANIYREWLTQQGLTL